MTDNRQNDPVSGDTSEWFLKQTEPEVGEPTLALGVLVLGRSKDCEIVLASGQASRRHAQVEHHQGQLFVEDLGSVNGTLVNDVRIEARTELAAGDLISVTGIVFEVIGPEPDEAEMATIIQAAPPPPDSPSPPAEPPPAAPSADADKQFWERAGESPGGGTMVMGGGAVPEKAPDGTMIARGVNVSGPSLVCVAGSHLGEAFALNPDSTTIGRSDANDVVLNDSTVSSKHAKIVQENGTWKIIDLMAANLTFVDGKRTQNAFLESGSSIKLGNVELRLALDQQEQTAFIRQSSEVPPAAAGAGSFGAQPGGGGVPIWLIVLISFLIVAAAGAAWLLFLR